MTDLQRTQVRHSAGLLAALAFGFFVLVIVKQWIAA